MLERETWASRVGFILAAVGSAVGLGNIWRFPYLTAESGGAAFLVVYLAAVLVIGFPAILAEFVLGRRSRRNVVDAFGDLGHPTWKAVGALALVTGFVILSYYSVVAGWVLRYIVGSATGAYFGGPEAYYSAIAVGMDAVAFHALFMLLTVTIVAFGVERGIELSTKVMVPSIILIVLGLAAWAFTLDGAAAGYAFYLEPNLGELTGNLLTVVPAAVGQALFTLSLGMGAMVTYASYVGDDHDLAVDGVSIVVLNTAVAVVAGLVVFPVLYARGIAPGEPGAGAIFVTMAGALSALPAGRIIGVVFFGVVAIAALSSAISLLEVVVSYLVDNLDYPRPVLAAAVGLAAFLVGLPTALDTDMLSTYDAVTGQLLLPLGAFLLVVFVGWIYGREAAAELGAPTGQARPHHRGWLWHLRLVIVLAVAGTLVVSAGKFAGIDVAEVVTSQASEVVAESVGL